MWNVRMIPTGLNIVQWWTWKELNQGDVRDEMVLFKIWSVPAGCTASGKRENEKLRGHPINPDSPERCPLKRCVYGLVTQCAWYWCICAFDNPYSSTSGRNASIYSLLQKAFWVFQWSTVWVMSYTRRFRGLCFLWLLRVLAVLRLNATLIFSFIIIIIIIITSYILERLEINLSINPVRSEE